MGISIRAYAKHKQVSDTAVHKAIRSGRIQTEPDGTIDPAKADAAWERNTDPARQRQPGSDPSPASSPSIQAALPRQSGRPSAPRLAPDHEPVASGTAVPNYQVSRAIRETYNAKLTRLDYEERQGRLVEADEVRTVAFNMARRVRDRLLGIPSRLSAVLASENDAKTVERLLDQEIRIALEELSR